MRYRLRLGSRFAAMISGSVLMFALAGLAPTPVNRSDNFNNNSLAAFWEAANFGNLAANETNSRLEFRSTGSTGMLSAAGVLFQPYGINWKQDFHIEWTGRMKIDMISFPRTCFMGTLLIIAGEYPDTMTGLGAGFYRDSSQLYFGVARFENGAVMTFDGSPTLLTADSLVEVDWDRSLDRLTAKLTGGPQGVHTGFFTDFGGAYGHTPMAIIQGIVTRNGHVPLNGSKARIDNWKAEFVRRNFPV